MPTVPSLAIVPTPYASNPIIPLVASSWYEKQVYDFHVMLNPADSTQMFMFASGMDASNLQTIGKFTAPTSGVENNTATWTSAGIVLSPGVGWDAGSLGIRLGSIQWDGTTYWMYYCSDDAQAIGLAKSTDGINFTKFGSAAILTADGQGRDDGTHVSQPAVHRASASDWTMIYSYRNGATILPALRYATSTDGESWTKGGAGDIFSIVNDYNEQHQIYKLSATDWLLLVESGDTDKSFKIWVGRAQAVIGPWTVPYEAWLSPSGTPSAWDRYHVATPFLYQMPSGNLKLFYCAAGTLDQPYTSNTWPGGVADVTALTTALKTSLVSLWKLDEASGSRADSHGTNTLTDNNSTPGSALVIGNGANFTTASSRFLSRADNSDLRMGDIDAVFAFWVARKDEDNCVLVSKDVDTPADSRDYTIDLDSNNLRFYVNGGAGGLLVSIAAPQPSTTGHFVVAWHDAAGNTLNIQLDNGTPVSQATGGAVPQSSVAAFRIGARQYAAFEGYADAIIDEVGYWKRLLTTAEKNELYSRGVGLPFDYFTNPTGPVVGAASVSIARRRKRGRWSVSSPGTFF